MNTAAASALSASAVHAAITRDLACRRSEIANTYFVDHFTINARPVGFVLLYDERPFGWCLLLDGYGGPSRYRPGVIAVPVALLPDCPASEMFEATGGSYAAGAAAWAPLA